MRRQVLWGGLCAVLATVGCAGSRRDAPGEWSNLPFVYKMTIQQGNIITADMVNRLEPGMTPAQVRYLLGTPLLTDPFHANRWDYPYTLQRGRGPMEAKHLTLYFENDALARIDGSLRPDPTLAPTDARERIVTVPDWEERRGLIARVLHALGIKRAP